MRRIANTVGRAYSMRPMTPPPVLHTAISRSVNRRAALEMLAASFAFATMSCIVHGFHGLVPWPVVSFTRILATSILVNIWVFANGLPFAFPGPRALWWRSIAGTVGLVCNFYSLSRLPVTDVVTVLSTSPIWVALILAIVSRRRPSFGAWLHAVLAAAGVYVMYRPSFDADLIPLAILVFCAFIMAIAQVSLSFCGDINPYTVVSHYSTVAAAICLGLCFVFHDPDVSAVSTNAGVWVWLVPMGLLGTIGQVLLTMAYGKGAPAMVALIGISQIAFAAFYDLAIWGNQFDFWKWIGVAMIATAIAMSVVANARAGRSLTEETPASA